MVLTQPNHQTASKPIKPKFPYHYGSYATRGIRRGCRATLRVSIPLWFLRNSSCLVRETEAIACFHTTMVLTQRAEKMKCIAVVDSVSIPLWFLRNLNCPSFFIFTPRKVSIPLWFLRNNKMKIIEEEHLGEFPYHYGSYATTIPEEICPWIYTVSIPLWFLRNCQGDRHKPPR